MFNAIVHFSIKNKLFVGLTTLFLLIGGIYAMVTLPIDAVPDITNNQVQIVTVSPTLAPQEVEQLITMPIEIAMSNIMNVEEIRSVSRFGLSLVTVVFKESVPTLDARQLINEQIQSVSGEIPPDLGTPELMPITTGLGEIYQYTLEVSPEYQSKYDAMELRTIQDWIVKRQLSGIPGIVEINSFGGYLKQYEVAVDPSSLYSLNITISDVYDALSRNNQNTGGSYIEKVNHAYYIRSEGMINDIKDIEEIVVANRGGIPIHINDVAKVRLGAPKRFGAMTQDGKGECVGGIAMMLKGANANLVTKELEKRVEKVQKMLPEGVSLEPYLNRSALVNRNISTVVSNLIDGAVIVFLVLILFLGNLRGGLIVASVIPLAMLFAFILMRVFGVSANLMSLGAIDFGIVVDGSIVIVEGILAHLYSRQFKGRTLSQEDMNVEVARGAAGVVRSATFAVLIILIVFFPILTLTGIEGKYFTPMAKTLVFCIIGALLLSLTYVPMMASLFLKKEIRESRTLGDRFFDWLNGIYQRSLNFCMHFKWSTIAVAFMALAGSLFLFTKLGAEFIPTLDEGDFAMQMTLPAGSSLTQSIELSNRAEKVLMDKFPEIKHVVAKIGTAEVPTDPMAVEDADVMIIMKPFDEWTSAGSRAEMVDKMKTALEEVEGAEFNFSQPIQLRFNELMTGAKADVAVKLYGEDMAELYARAKEAAAYVEKVPGAADVIVEQAMGLPQLVVEYDRSKIARYGMNIQELNTIIRTAYAGEVAGVVFENERRFELVVRLDQEKVADLNLDKLFVRTSEGVQIPVSEVAHIELVNGPLQINRDATKRRIVIGVNVRDADVQQVVAGIQETLDKNIKLKPGYYFEYGGQFENLKNAINTLLIVVPVALSLILLLLFFAFKSVTYTLVVFSTVPLSLIGGVLALWMRDLPFSISAGVGFIALFGVSVLNGILMINRFNEYRRGSVYARSTGHTIRECCPHLLRPVFLTGLVASLGFVPMAIATSAGAEVQRPLATVVIGGLIVSTILTLIIIPLFYYVANSMVTLKRGPLKKLFGAGVIVLLLGLPSVMQAQETGGVKLSVEQAVDMALQNSPRLKNAAAGVELSRAAKGEVVDLPATELSYSWGQLNGEYRNDKQMEVTQSLGSLLTPFYKNALVNRKVETGMLYKQLVEKEVIAEVKRAWWYYVYTYNMMELSREQSELADRLQRAGELRYEQGEITLVEKSMSATLAADMRTKLYQAGEELRLAASRLQWVCYSPEPVTADRTDISLLSPDLDTAGVSSLYRDYFGSLAEEKRAEARVEKSRFFPELSFGYVRQSIDPLKGLNSWMAGVSFPVWFVPQRSRVKQARIAANMAQTDSELNIRELDIRLQELRVQLNKYRESIRYYKASALSEAEQLMKAAALQFRESETDVTDFIQSLNAVRSIKQGYIDAVYQYNIAALEYELYR